MATRVPFANCKAESKAVKEALKHAGIPVLSVGHGRGTSQGWLYIRMSEPSIKHRCLVDGQIVELDRHEQIAAFARCVNINGGCPACAQMDAFDKSAIGVAQDVTGRSGKYDGCINTHWTE